MAAVEFALLVPVLFLIMLGGLQLLSYINAVRKVNVLTQSISQMLTQATPPSGSTTATVSALDLHFSYDASLVVFPYLLKDAQQRGVAWWQSIQINFASIAFTKKAATCTNSADQSNCYTAKVVWTSTGVNATGYRPCTTPQLPADNAAAPSPTTLPRSVFGPASLVAVDVVFTFRPTFGASFIPPIKILRSVYTQPRYASLIDYDLTNNDGIASKCPSS